MVETLTTNEVTSILLAIGLLLFSTTLGGIFENTIYQKILKEGQDKLTMESCRVQVLTLLHTDPENVSAILKLSETYFVTLNGDTYVTDVFHDWIEDQTFSYPDWWLDICHEKGIEYDKDRNKHIREKPIKSREDKKE